MFSTYPSSCSPELMQELHVLMASLLAKHKGTSASGILHLESAVLNPAGVSAHKGAGQLPSLVPWLRAHRGSVGAALKG